MFTHIFLVFNEILFFLFPHLWEKSILLHEHNSQRFFRNWNLCVTNINKCSKIFSLSSPTDYSFSLSHFTQTHVHVRMMWAREWNVLSVYKKINKYSALASHEAKYNARSRIKKCWTRITILCNNTTQLHRK